MGVFGQRAKRRLRVLMGSFSKLQWMDAVRQCMGITAERRIVISHIGATADQNGCDAWRDNKTVAAEVGVSEDTITRARKDGIKHGLWVETRPSRGGRGTAGRSAEYQLIMPENTRTAADESPEKVRTSAEKGPQESRKRSAPERTPSGISSGSSSGSDGTTYTAVENGIEKLLTRAEHDALPF